MDSIGRASDYVYAVALRGVTTVGMRKGPHERPKVHVVTKSDVGMRGASYVVGVFFNSIDANKACVGPGTFTVHNIDPSRVYPRGTMLDVVVIDNVTAASIATAP